MKTNKKSTYLFASLIALISFGACSSNDEWFNKGKDDDKEVKFQSALISDQASTRIARDPNDPDKTKWVAGDQIGIIAYDGDQKKIDDYHNLAFKALEGNATTGFEAVNKKILYPQDGAKLFFKAYYPFTESSTWKDGQIVVDLTDQSDLGKIDLLYTEANNKGQGYDISYQETPIALSFKHQLSFLSLTILPFEEGMDVSNVKITLRGLPNKVLFDTETGKLKTETGDVKISVPSNANGKYEAILSPVAVSSAIIEIKNGDTEYTLDLANSFAKLEKGKKYSLNIKVKKNDELSLEGSIEDWEEIEGDDVILNAVGDKAVLLRLLKENNELLAQDGKKLTMPIEDSPISEIKDANWTTEKDVHKWYGIEWETIGGAERVVALNFCRSNIRALSAEINKLECLKKIVLLQTNIDDISMLSGHPRLEELSPFTDKIETIALSDMPNLRSIWTTDTGTPVREIALSNMPKLESIASYGWNQAIKLTLSNMPSLKSLSIFGCKNLETVSIRELDNLKSISIDETKLKNISFLSHLTNLEVIQLQKVEFSDLSPLAGLINLRMAIIKFTPISNVSALSKHPKLELLDLRENKNLKSISLSGMTNLQEIELGGSGIMSENDVNICGIQNLEGLKITSDFALDKNVLCK